MNSPLTPVRVEAVLLDAFGTLLHLDDPVPRLGALLAAEGHRHAPERVGKALAQEIAYYRRNLHRGADAASLATLRLDCAGVLAEALDGDAPAPPRLAEILLDALRFSLQADAIPALDALEAAGMRIAVVSNWDCSLPDVLAGLGVADRFDAICASAAVGAAKPDPTIFLHALGRLGVPAARAVHCGDSPEADCAGALGAGIRGVLIDRSGVLSTGPCPALRTLLDVARWTIA